MRLIANLITLILQQLFRIFIGKQSFKTEPIVPSQIREEIFNFRTGITLENERELHGYEEDITVADLLSLESVFVLKDAREFKDFAEAVGEILPEF